MSDNSTTKSEELTFIQRFFARLTDPSPARYSAAIQNRTFGRVHLDDTPAPAKSAMPRPKSQSRQHHTAPECAA